MNKPAWVLDTNVVLDLLHFDDPVARPLRRALEDERVTSMVSDATLDELQRVLAYPEFSLDSARQDALYKRYLAMSEKVVGVGANIGLPRCSDPDDQKFIELAAAGQAHMLISKDRALLKLRRRCIPFFRVLAPGEAVRWLAAAAD